MDVAQVPDKRLNEKGEQMDSEPKQLRSWELVDFHGLDIWEFAPVPAFKTIPICYKIMYHLNPTSPDLLVTKKGAISRAPWQVPHLHNQVESKLLIFPLPLEIGQELEAFHFLDLLVHIEWIEIV